jgi:hypothetical protein
MSKFLRASILLSVTAFPGLTTTVSAQDQLNRHERAAMLLTPGQVADKVVVKGETDELSPIIWLSTQEFLKSDAGDKFLRAGFDRKKGEFFYQIYLQSVSRQAFRPDSATFMAGGELQTVKADRISFDVSCSRYSCLHYEDTLIELTRANMDEFASCASPGEDASFRVRVFGATTEGQDVSMFCTEAAGLLLAVERLADRLNHSPAPP